MFGSIGGSEFLLIAVLALLLFGPRKLPQIGRSLGRALADFRGATQDFKSSLEREVRVEEIREAKSGIEEVSSEISGAVREATRPTVARDPAPSAGVTPSSKPAADGAPDGETAPPSDGSSHGETSAQS